MELTIAQVLQQGITANKEGIRELTVFIVSSYKLSLSILLRIMI